VYVDGGFLDWLSYYQFFKKDVAAWNWFILGLESTFETACTSNRDLDSRLPYNIFIR
jgi:hypothetical protein